MLTQQFLSVIPAQAGIQAVISGSPVKLGMTGGDGSPIRSASLSVEDDKGCVIPAPLSLVIPAPFSCYSRENGNPAGLDPQSEALRFRLGMTPGLSVEDDTGAFD